MSATVPTKRARVAETTGRDDQQEAEPLMAAPTIDEPDFNLNALIREALRKSREPDPHIIANRLVARIPAEHVRAALASCLHDRVRIILSQERMSSTVVEPKAGESWTRQARDVLRERRYVPARAEWMHVGDMTVEDCESVAVDHERRAAQEAAVAARFRGLADQLRASGAVVVRDLGDEAFEAAA